jgi:hypothetical protein
MPVPAAQVAAPIGLPLATVSTNKTGDMSDKRSSSLKPG